MKPAIILLLSVFILSCKQKRKDPCEWRTVAELQALDLAKCRKPVPFDSMYHFMKDYSGGLNVFRKDKGIPVLPLDAEAELFSVNNQIRWHGDFKNGEFVEMKKPFMKWKDLQWDRNTLIYDRTIFVEDPAKDRNGNTLFIVYSLDTASAGGRYLFRYEYDDSSNRTTILTKFQSDSVLKAWKLDQFR